MIDNNRLIILIFLILAVSITIVQSRCPNSCNGHGTCANGNTCQCFTGFKGGAADCSMRECPVGPAWADKAYATDLAHQNVECSNAGLCDRNKGQCKCYPGYTGNACQRNSCPNDCSGHGSCITLRDLSIFSGPDYDNTVAGSGDGLGTEYQNWDGNSITICDCDSSYFGSDCSLSMCPKGDDPLTLNQNNRQVLLTVTASAFAGSLGIEFKGETSFISLTNPSDSNCVAGLKTSGKIGIVGCEYTVVSGTEITFKITFYSWPTYSKENNLHSHNGNPLITDFYCDNTLSTNPVSCLFSDVQNTNIKGN
jgi:hypothetical protein